MLINALLLAYYDLDSQYILETNTSDTIIVVIFSQKRLDGEWHPVGYFFKTIAPAETNYLIHDKEILAIVKTL
jgi:RNase H-like domain found in reverse transcriptase